MCLSLNWTLCNYFYVSYHLYSLGTKCLTYFSLTFTPCLKAFLYLVVNAIIKQRRIATEKVTLGWKTTA